MAVENDLLISRDQTINADNSAEGPKLDGRYFGTTIRLSAARGSTRHLSVCHGGSCGEILQPCDVGSRGLSCREQDFSNMIRPKWLVLILVLALALPWAWVRHIERVDEGFLQSEINAVHDQCVAEGMRVNMPQGSLFFVAIPALKVVEFYGGPHDGQRRETNDDTIALTMPWEGCIYLYKQRANWGQTPVMFDYTGRLTQAFGQETE